MGKEASGLSINAGGGTEEGVEFSFTLLSFNLIRMEKENRVTSGCSPPSVPQYISMNSFITELISDTYLQPQCNSFKFCFLNCGAKKIAIAIPSKNVPFSILHYLSKSKDFSVKNICQE